MHAKDGEIYLSLRRVLEYVQSTVEHSSTLGVGKITEPLLMEKIGKHPGLNFMLSPSGL